MFGLSVKRKAKTPAQTATRSIKPAPSELTDTQLILLPDPDGRVSALGPTEADKVLPALQTLEQIGLIARDREQGPVVPGHPDLPLSPTTYSITQAGLEAIGISDSENPVAGGLPEFAATGQIGGDVAAKVGDSAPEVADHALALGPDRPVELPETEPEAKPGTKINKLTARLAVAGGARMEDLQTLTGWQPHTIRAALSRLRKQGLAIKTDRTGNLPTVYRLLAGAKMTVGGAQTTSPDEANEPGVASEGGC